MFKDTQKVLRFNFIIYKETLKEEKKQHYKFLKTQDLITKHNIKENKVARVKIARDSINTEMAEKNKLLQMRQEQLKDLKSKLTSLNC